MEQKNLIGKEILNYRIESSIGGGGMGSVWKATHKFTGEIAAIKVLKTNFVESEFSRKKFVQEAQTLGKLSHQNIVQYRGFDENEDGVFLVMEYVDGITLEDFINQKQGLIPEKMAYPMFLQILDACAYAHKHGIVHCDIKPANIILTSDNEGNFVVKILDFGIAQILSESKKAVGYTLSYASPEQIQNEDIDCRSDIYSLGVLLHKMLTGHAPYDTTTLSDTDLAEKIIGEPLPRMKEFYNEVSEKMQRIVDKATQKDPAKRYQTCGDFRAALKNAIDPDKLPKVLKYAAAVLILLLLGGGLWYWDYNYNVKTYYYKDYVEKWGVPIGIGKLSNSDAEQKMDSYRFIKLKGKITRVSHVNSKGNIVEHHDSEHTERYDDMLLYYTDNGKLNYKKCLDRNGKVLYRMAYIDENLKAAIFTQDDDTKTELNLSASTTQLFASAFSTSNGKSRISKYLFTYDENGYLKQVKYASGKLPQVCDAEGIYGKKFVVDEKGRVIEEYYLGKDDAPKANRAGLAIKKLEYNKDNDFVKVSYFTANGEKGYDGNGCYICAIEYDKYGNRIKETYYDSEENITLRTDNKVAGYNYIVENGFMIQQTAFGVDGTKSYVSRDEMNTNNDMFGFVSMKFDYDANGYVSKIAYLDTEDKSVIISTGVAIIELENDQKGNSLTQNYLDTAGIACENIYGYSKSVAEYDMLGNMLSVSFKDTKDNLCTSQYGCAGFRNEYDAHSRLVKQMFFGTDSKPCENTAGIVIAVSEYDQSSDNLKKITFYAADGKTLKLSEEGITGYESEYNNDGYEVERKFFDAKNNSTAGNLGFARWTNKYDENGFLKEEAYFDKNGSPTVFNNQQSGFRYSKIEYVYDADKGNNTEQILYEGNAKTLIVRFTYNNKITRYQSIALFNANGVVTTNAVGCHKVEFTYDNREQETERRHYNTAGKLTLIPDNAGYYAIHKNEYDRMGRISRQTYFGTDELPTSLSMHVPEGLTGYDKQGNRNYIASADGNGKVIDNPKTGFAYGEMQHDAKGFVTEERFYTSDKKLIRRCTTEYDKKGISTCKCYDANNKLLGTEKYDQNTGKAESDYWRQYFQHWAAQCPLNIDYGIICTSISLTGNGCVQQLQFTGVSKYQQTADELEACKDFARQHAAAIKKESKMPSSVSLVTIGVDKSKIEIFRITH
ncbi:MAG: serine/threonine protein kinase [Dysgonamonadaceae bacterium]|jgi:serine/threonine-protein kinase|nr:serine/threonine protein kinase [Dysgonamonadaceae bacterium]